ncbi:MAG: hydrogenase maturation nickel metallochaperone HypA [Kiritimatiellales bacterium]|nr:hydrogenase maturation nickel metallochaperone HypA [Kiritimatiellales bacterium]MCF7864468.1 hydrogenase maturation nickel metallochaperone HypA [Kiritimatiellales bacterium]
MHELSLAQELVEHIARVAKSENALRVERVVVVIGRYSGVEREAFEFAFPFAAEGTIAEGAELLIEERPATVWCRNCNSSSHVASTHLTCGNCGSTEVALTDGREFMIQSIQLEVPDR